MSQPLSAAGPSNIQRLLRDKTSDLYYRNGNWISQPDSAQNFSSLAEPTRIARTFSDKDLELVIRSLECEEASIPLSMLIRLGVSFKD